MTGAVVPTATAAESSGPTSLVALLRRVWRRIPLATRLRLFELTHRSGLPFVVSYLADHRARHSRDRFAGRIPALQEEYLTASSARRAELLAQFDRIADSIVLPNGVRKTTYAGRPSALLREVLLDPVCVLPDRSLRVLDVPASTGATAAESFGLLVATHSVREYVLADLAFDLLYDRARDCIFDAEGTLLQVGHPGGFTSTFVPHSEGVEASWFTRWLLGPAIARGERLRRTFQARDAVRLDSIPIVRPDVVERHREGGLTLQSLDVFAPIPGFYDVILSFNLLQRNYFSPERMEAGIANLTKALAPDGILIVGRPDADGASAHRVYRRCGERAVLIREHGTL
jgi:hypothetical protein